MVSRRHPFCFLPSWMMMVVRSVRLRLPLTTSPPVPSTGLWSRVLPTAPAKPPSLRMPIVPGAYRDLPVSGHDLRFVAPDSGDLTAIRSREADAHTTSASLLLLYLVEQGTPQLAEVCCTTGQNFGYRALDPAGSVVFYLVDGFDKAQVLIRRRNSGRGR